MDLFNTIASKLAAFPLGWSVSIMALGYIIVVLKRSDAIQEARLSDYKDMLSKYTDLLSKMGGK